MSTESTTVAYTLEQVLSQLNDRLDRVVKLQEQENTSTFQVDFELTQCIPLLVQAVAFLAAGQTLAPDDTAPESD